MVSAVCEIVLINGYGFHCCSILLNISPYCFYPFLFVKKNYLRLKRGKKLEVGLQVPVESMVRCCCGLTPAGN